MRGDDRQQAAMWSTVSPGQRVPPDHPLRPLRALVDAVLADLSPRSRRLYAKEGRPSIAPEKLLRALLLQVLYSVRGERQLREPLDYPLRFRWFVGLNLDDPVGDPTVFTQNRQRLLDGDVAQAFFDAVLAPARGQQLLSQEHFTVDATLIEAWAGLKSFRPRGTPAPPPDGPGNPTANFHGERRRNAPHASTTAPEARPHRQGDRQGHVLLDNRHGLVAGTALTPASNTAEREAALQLAARGQRRGRGTLGADKAHDTRAFVAAVRALGLAPHVAQHTPHRASAVDGRTTRHAGYARSQRVRKRVEAVFGWLKTVALLGKTRHRGAARVGWIFPFGAAAYNLVRLRHLGVVPT